MSSKSCPRCRGVVVFDSFAGEEVCTKCGFVLQQGVAENSYNPWRKNKSKLGGIMGT